MLLAASACGRLDFVTADASHAPLDALVTYREAILADAPLAYLRLGELGTGGIAIDETGANNASVVGGCTFGVPGALAGDTDTAVGFDGSTCKLVFAGSAFGFPGTAPFTIEAWLSTTMDTGFHHVFAKEARDTVNTIDGYGLLVAPTGFELERVVTMAIIKTPALPVVAGFHHVVAVYTGTQVALYVDDALVGETGDPRAMNAIASTPLAGASVAGNYFHGVIDELAVYGTPLGLEQIQRHYHLAGR